MSITRFQQVFPLDNEALAITTSIQENKKSYQFRDPIPYTFIHSSASKLKTPHSYSSSYQISEYWGDHHYQPYILPNGLFIHSLGDWRGGGWESPSYLLNYDSTTAHVAIPDALDPSLLTVVSTSSEHMRLACASRDRKNIHMYNLRVSSVLTQETGGIPRPTAEYGLNTKVPNGVIFTVKSDSETILSLAAFSVTTPIKNMIAISLSTGKIKVGHIHKNKFILDANLEFPLQNDRPKAIKLLADSSEGILIGYANETIRIWDGNNNFCFYDFPCPKLFNLNLSTSGKYLTGLVDQETEKSTQLFVIALDTKTEIEKAKIYKIPLRMPLSDFVIGKDDYASVGGTLSQEGFLSIFSNEPTNASQEKMSIFIKKNLPQIGLHSEPKPFGHTFNPFDPIAYSSDKQALSRITQTSLKQKLITTFQVFNGNNPITKLFKTFKWNSRAGLFDFATFFVFKLIHAAFHYSLKLITSDVSKYSSMQKAGIYLAKILVTLPLIVFSLLHIVGNGLIRPAVSTIATIIFSPIVLLTHGVSKIIAWQKSNNVSSAITVESIPSNSPVKIYEALKKSGHTSLHQLKTKEVKAVKEDNIIKLNFISSKINSKTIFASKAFDKNNVNDMQQLNTLTSTSKAVRKAVLGKEACKPRR